MAYWFQRHTHGRSGQGIIEYVGALVVAATLIAGMLSLGPNGMADVFMSVVDEVETAIMAVLQGI